MTSLALKLYFTLRLFLPQECPLLFCLWETRYHWTVCPLLPTLPPLSLVFCQLQFWPFWLNILCCWKLCLPWNMSWNHMLASCLWAPGEATSTSLAGQAERCPNQTFPKIVCETRQDCSSTQGPKQDTQIKENENTVLQKRIAELDTYQGCGVLNSPHSNMLNINVYYSQLKKGP